MTARSNGADVSAMTAKAGTRANNWHERGRHRPSGRRRPLLKLSLWCPRIRHRVNGAGKNAVTNYRVTPLAQHRIHHLGVDGVVSSNHSPSSLQVYLKITVVFPGLGGLGHRPSPGRPSCTARHRKEPCRVQRPSPDTGWRSPRRSCSADLQVMGPRQLQRFVLVDRHAADLVVKALEVGLGILALDRCPVAPNSNRPEASRPERKSSPPFLTSSN